MALARPQGGVGLVQSPLRSAGMPLGGGDLPQPLPGAAEENGGPAAAAGSGAGRAAGAGAGRRGDGVSRRAMSAPGLSRARGTCAPCCPGSAA